MLIGYMRVSTGEQSLDLQRDALERAGCERVFEDVCSGTVAERPGLSRALAHARSGDVLVVWKLDHIGRSLQHIVQPVAGLRERGVGLKVLTGEIDRTSRSYSPGRGHGLVSASFDAGLVRVRLARNAVGRFIDGGAALEGRGLA